MFQELGPLRPGWVLRQLFVLALRQNVPNVGRIWHRFAHHICDDLSPHAQKYLPNGRVREVPHPIEQDYGLFVIDGLLCDHNKSLTDFLFYFNFLLSFFYAVWLN